MGDNAWRAIVPDSMGPMEFDDVFGDYSQNVTAANLAVRMSSNDEGAVKPA